MVCGKNGIAKDQLDELGILEKKVLDQLSGWLKVGKCVRVGQGSSQAWAWWKCSSVFCFLWFHVFPKLLSLCSLSIPTTLSPISIYWITVPDTVGARDSDVQSSWIESRQVSCNTKVFSKGSIYKILRWGRKGVSSCVEGFFAAVQGAFWRKTGCLPHGWGRWGSRSGNRIYQKIKAWIRTRFFSNWFNNAGELGEE